MAEEKKEKPSWLATRPTGKEKDVDLSLLKEMAKRLGIKEVPAPKTVTVIFPRED